MKRLLLIDGNAILHRAYHAYPPNFTDKDGNPTNAIYGFYAMLLKLLQDVKPDYLAIAFDRGAPTFRMNMYAGYHENRPRMQDGLASQVSVLHKSLEEIGIPLYGVEGYEADDLLGTLSWLASHPSRHSSEQSQVPYGTWQSASRIKEKKDPGQASRTEEDVETIIVTGDRDLLQLVDDKVKILMPLVGITKTALFDERRVEDKYGIRPSQFIDYKALVGDTSDNYPGVTGIGPKGAAQLLQQYGTFENIYKKIEELPKGTAEKLATDAEQASLAKQLATIKRDAPVHLNLKDCVVAKFTEEKFNKVFDELNFASLKKRMQGEGINVLKDTKDAKKKKPHPQSVQAQLELI